MIDSTEKLISTLMGLSFSIVRTAYIQRSRFEKDRIAEARQWLVSRGYEEIEVDPSILMLDDGREVFRAQGKTWVLTLSVHEERLNSAINRAIMMETAHKGIDTIYPFCTKLIGDQVCGGELQHDSVCPKSVLGLSGVVATLSCPICEEKYAVLSNKE